MPGGAAGSASVPAALIAGQPSNSGSSSGKSSTQCLGKRDGRQVYPGAVHAFTNPEATENGKQFNLPLAYQAEADQQSKAEMVKFFAGLFGKK